ncbi:23S ribosomal RNA methyltransferase Erm [Cohnella laeviribosi]|uniref:23S ribosomal RNA methyltransferase Erm n=1 Tax=Cohnella laeviribosi TaxID=380174 RepID=UPI003D1AE4A6
MTRNTSGDPPNFLGQHFLHHRKIIREIIDQAIVGDQETVLELGAGKGALTFMLAQKAGKVLAVEYDAKLVESLKQKAVPYPNIHIIHQDILKMRLPKGKFIVVSNIPYSITTPIMKMLLNAPSNGFQRGVMVVEKGAAKRFTSKWVKDGYVAAWRMYFDLTYVKEISRNHFSPPPNVDSAMITINRKATPMVPVKDYLAFRGLADYALMEPRASIDWALKGVFTPPQIRYLKRKLGLKQDVPVACLSELQWGLIFETMKQLVPRFRWPKAKKEKRGRNERIFDDRSR